MKILFRLVDDINIFKKRLEECFLKALVLSSPVLQEPYQCFWKFL